MRVGINYALLGELEKRGYTLNKDPENGGYDVIAAIDEPIHIGPLERVLVPTGVFLSPDMMGVHCDIRSTSGLPNKHGIVTNLGLVDWGYRGEVKALAFNLSRDCFTIQPFSKIGQLVFFKELDTEMILTPKSLLGETNRGDKGFGAQSGVT